MTHEQAQWLRLAVAIYAAHQNKPASPASVELPTATWQMCRTVAHRIATARARGWLYAVERLERDFHSLVRELRGELDTLCARFNSLETVTRFATVRDIYHDLLALCSEFEQVAYDRRGHTLSVTTEPIELEGLFLGPFEIRFKWGEFAQSGLPHYQVIATDPHPAGANDSVTHPHVEDESVCEGDGRGPIRKALEQGRLLDFFLIVAGILRTYNDGSPYVALTDWDGVNCSDCGGNMSADDRWSCERCGEDLCDDCRLACTGCDGTFCGNDIICCTKCNDYYCSGCLPNHQSEESLTCQNCLDEASKEDSDNDDESAQQVNEDPDAAVQPDGVGQAAVSA